MSSRVIRRPASQRPVSISSLPSIPEAEPESSHQEIEKEVRRLTKGWRRQRLGI